MSEEVTQQQDVEENTGNEVTSQTNTEETASEVEGSTGSTDRFGELRWHQLINDSGV